MNSIIETQEAVQKWVSTFNELQMGMFRFLVNADIDAWHEVTRPSLNNTVDVMDLARKEESNSSQIIFGLNGKVERILSAGNYLILLPNGEKITRSRNTIKVSTDSFFPMWYVLWSFADSCDKYWLSQEQGIQDMSSCGFRVYQHEEWGFFFGIDGEGYNFYDAHWIPLYKKRGLQ